jgi:hypothetical protein
LFAHTGNIKDKIHSGFLGFTVFFLKAFPEGGSVELSGKTDSYPDFLIGFELVRTQSCCESLF